MVLLAEADLTKILVVLAYLVAVGYLAYRGWRKTKTTSDYLLAGRQMHPFVMAMSYGATFISTSAIVGFGGAASIFGMSLLWLAFLNILVGIFIAFVFLGGPTRRMGHRLDAHTFPELLGRRFGSKFIQFFSGAVIFVLMPLYTAVVIIGAGRLLQVQFGWPYEAALFSFGVIVAVYVITGGLKGVMYTDALQGSIMFVGMLLILILTYASFGGVQTAHEKLEALPKVVAAGPETAKPDADKVMAALQAAGLPADAKYDAGLAAMAKTRADAVQKAEQDKKPVELADVAGMKFDDAETALRFAANAPKSAGFLGVIRGKGWQGWAEMPAFDVGGKPEQMEYWLTVVTSIVLGVGIGVLAQPQLAVRFMTVKGKRELNRAVLTGGVFILMMTGTAFAVGAMSNLWFYENPATRGLVSLLAAGKDVDKVMPTYIEGAMHPAISAVWLVTLLAAAMSTVSSQFHAMGTSVGRDMAAPFSRKGGSAGLTRAGIAVTFLISICLAYFLPRYWDKADAIIARATAIFFGVCAATFLPMFVGALFCRKMSKAAAVWGMLAGFFVMMFGFFFLHEKESSDMLLCAAMTGQKCLVGAPWKWVDPLVYGLPISVLVTILVALFTKAPSAEQVEKCFGEGPKGS